jgi:hypothetical protein
MFKKLIVTVVILATATTAIARDITVSFADGSTHQYNNTPNSVTPEQIQDRVAQDFPSKQLVNIDGGADRVIQSTKPSNEESTFWPTVGKIVVGVIVIGALAYGIRHIPAAKAYPCTLPTDHAKDGSICGARASSVRPGGR